MRSLFPKQCKQETQTAVPFYLRSDQFNKNILTLHRYVLNCLTNSYFHLIIRETKTGKIIASISLEYYIFQDEKTISIPLLRKIFLVNIDNTQTGYLKLSKNIILPFFTNQAMNDLNKDRGTIRRHGRFNQFAPSSKGRQLNSGLFVR